MAEIQKANLTDEQKAAIEHHIKQNAKEKFGTAALILSLSNPNGTNLDAKIRQWEEEKRNELSNPSPEKLDELVKEHQKFLEIQKLDTNNDKKIDKSEATEFVARTLKDATKKLGISGESLSKNKGNYTNIINEIKDIASKHGLRITDQATQAGLDSYNESNSTTSKLPRQKPQQTAGKELKL